jgi:hypothetical protein
VYMCIYTYIKVTEHTANAVGQWPPDQRLPELVKLYQLWCIMVFVDLRRWGTVVTEIIH